jgi:hypothetical protein
MGKGSKIRMGKMSVEYKQKEKYIRKCDKS